jgi:hypothetical protein
MNSGFGASRSARAKGSTSTSPLQSTYFPDRRLGTSIVRVADNTLGGCRAFSEKRVFSSQVPRAVRWHLLSAWKVCPISVDAPYRQPPTPPGAIVDNADAVTAEVDRRAPVPAAN